MAILRRGETSSLARRAQGQDPFEAMRDLMAWDPFQGLVPGLQRLWRGEERMAFVPSFDVRETKDAYVFKADVPGLKEQDLDINVTGNRLTVSGKRESEEVNESDTYYASERSYGSFARSFTLPEGINSEQIHAELKEGVLAIHVPKAAEAQPKRISVGAGSEKKLKA